MKYLHVCNRSSVQGRRQVLHLGIQNQRVRRTKLVQGQAQSGGCDIVEIILNATPLNALTKCIVYNIVSPWLSPSFPYKTRPHLHKSDRCHSVGPYLDPYRAPATTGTALNKYTVGPTCSSVYWRFASHVMYVQTVPWMVVCVKWRVDKRYIARDIYSNIYFSFCSFWELSK